MTKKHCWAGVTLLLATVSGPPVAEATVIDFETPETSTAPESLPGGTYASSGVSFQTGAISGLVVGGGTITFAFESATFRMYEGSNAISGDQFIGADVGGGARDLLMQFSTPVTSVSVVSDATVGEGPDIIRLIALQALGGGSYEVLAFASAFDDAPTGTFMSISLPSEFSYVLFEVTTEQEGFDDLTFTPVPEPTTLALLGAGLVALHARRRRSA
jgi:PEP-CTERM motif-containing protein